MDPHFGQTATINSYTLTADSLMENLRGTGSPFESEGLRPLLIHTVEQADPVTFLLGIREGVKFHDKPPVNGRVMEARDVVYSLDSARGSIFPDETHPRKSGFFGVKDVTATEKNTVRVDFDAPSSVFFNAVLGEQRLIVIPEGLREDLGVPNLHDLNPDYNHRHRPLDRQGIRSPGDLRAQPRVLERALPLRGPGPGR